MTLYFVAHYVRYWRSWRQSYQSVKQQCPDVNLGEGALRMACLSAYFRWQIWVICAELLSLEFVPTRYDISIVEVYSQKLRCGLTFRYTATGSHGSTC